jgi:multiple sugar transport system permease protein
MEVVARARARPRTSWAARREWWGLAFVLPALIWKLGFNIIPMANAFYISLTSYDLLTPPRFVGLDNYVSLASDQRFYKAMGNTFGYAFGRGIPLVVIALFIAWVFARPFRGKHVFRLLYFMPVIVSGVVISIVWSLLYDPNGMINQLLMTFGFPRTLWLTRGDSAPWAIIIMAVWQSIGFYMIIFLAGLEGVPADFYDAATVDGANAWQKFWYVTMPLIKPTTLFVLVINVINGFQAFTYQFVMTRGGPSDATNVVSLLVYDTGLQFHKMGLASAMSLVLFLVIMAFTLFQMKVVRADDTHYA